MLNLTEVMVSQFAPACPCCGHSNPRSSTTCEGCGGKLGASWEPVSLTYIHESGLATNCHIPVDESLNLRRLKMAVAGLEANQIDDDDFHFEVMDVLEGLEPTIRGFWRLFDFKELGPTFKDLAESTVAAAIQFREACHLMVDSDPRGGLEQAREALLVLDEAERFARELIAA